MKKKNIIIISSVIGFLLVVVTVTALLNAGSIDHKKVLEQEAVIQVSTGGDILGKIDMDLIDRMGRVDFTASLDTSDSDPEEHIYTGVLLNNALMELDVDVGDYDTVLAKAIDGHNVIFEASEIQDQDNIYLAVARNGQSLGTKSTGGSGPYQIIVREDAFSQRWCKFVIELELR